MKMSVGCYRLDLAAAKGVGSDGESRFSGTFRVTEHGGTYKASGDLYRNTGSTEAHFKKAEAAAPGNRIPRFPIEDYRYYLEVLEFPSMSEGSRPVKMRVRMHKLDAAQKKLIPGGVFQLLLTMNAKGDSWAGTLQNGARVEATVTLSLIQPKFVRSAELRILRTSPLIELPGWKASMGDLQDPRKDWEDVFADAHWDFHVTQLSKSEILTALLDRKVWSVHDLSLQSFNLRKSCDPRNWTVDLLCVGEIGRDSHLLGLMFDNDAVDLDRKPRESAAVAAFQQVILPSSLAPKGNSKPYLQDYLDGAAYYRTALHEIGHAFNLTHNFREDSLMNTTQFLIDQLPEKPKVNQPFKPVWKFSGAELDWLQHAPDIAVRPGGIMRRGVQLQDELSKLAPAISTRAVTSLELKIHVVTSAVPLGAPVRLDYVLKNLGAAASVPRDLSLGAGFLTGRVKGPDFRTRTFRSVFRSCGAMTSLHRMQTLDKGSSLQGSMTLLQGTQGPLFPLPGRYEVELELQWDSEGEPKRLRQSARVDVEPLQTADPIQRLVVERVFTQSGLASTLIQGLFDPVAGETLSLALRSETLQPHYLPMALKCLQVSTWSRSEWKSFFDSLKEIGPAHSAPQISKSEVVTEHWERKALMPWLRNLDRSGLQAQRWDSLRVDSLSLGLEPTSKNGHGRHGMDEEVALWIEAFKQATFPGQSKGPSGPAQPPSDGMKSGAA